jgi:flagellar FliL protein
MANPPKDTAAAGAEPPKKKSKLMLIIAVAVVTLGGGGAGAWYVMRPAADPNSPKSAHEAKPAVFLPLESFTVNLVGPDSQQQYLQAGLTLKLGAEVKVDAIKDRMPEIRNRILLVLSGKKASDLLSVSGKNKLAAEIAQSVKDVVGPAAFGKAAAHAAPAQAEPSSGEAAAASTPPAHDAKAAAAAEAATHPAAASQQVEVLFTSFIIQ